MQTARENFKYNYEHYVLLPEDKRYELIEGDFYMVPSPSPYHQDIILETATRVRAYIKKKDLGKVFVSPLDVKLSIEDTVQPDIFFISRHRLGIIDENKVEGPPDLVIEVLSRHKPEYDLVLKRRIFNKVYSI